jgi:uncharacterized protein
MKGGKVESNIKYKFSKFNFFFKDKENKHILYNSSTGVLASLDDSNFRKLNEFIQGKNNGLDHKVLDNLIKTRFIIKDDIDELKEFKIAQAIRKFKTNELILNIIPTMDCNFRCRYCYQHDRNPQRMDQLIQDSIIRAVENRGNILSKLTVMWYGGEPLLTMDIIEHLSRNFMRLSKKHNFDYYANISTNGFLLSKDVIKKLLNYKVKEYQISFDGPPKTHNQRRIHKDGSPTFDRVFNNLKIFQEFKDDFQASIRIHFDTSNVDEINQLLEIFSRQFSDDRRFKIYFQHYHSMNEATIKKCGFGPPPAEKIPEIIMKLYRSAVEKGLNVSIPTRTTPRFFYCEAELNYYYLINYNGDILACVHTLDPKSKIGEVTQTGDLKISHEKRTPWLTKDPLEEEKCRKCNLLPLCSGGCAYQKVFHNNIKCLRIKPNFKKILNLLIQ